MVEGAPLLREYTGNGIEGSNPFFSASFLDQAIDFASGVRGPGALARDIAFRHGSAGLL